MLNGPIQLNVLANVRNEGAFIGAVSSEIGDDGPGAGVSVSVP